MTDAPETMTLPDFRDQVFAAQDWVAGLVEGTPDQAWQAPTPCAEFDVADLVKHLYGVADRVIATGHGQAPVSVPAFVDDLPDRPAAGLRERIARGREAWVDGTGLTTTVEAPWGMAPGAIVLGVYVAENLAHGWDLAIATGQDSEADPGLAAVALQVMHRALPADGRDGFPFAEPVPSTPEAGPTEQLANWLGRARP